MKTNSARAAVLSENVDPRQMDRIFLTALAVVILGSLVMSLFS